MVKASTYYDAYDLEKYIKEKYNNNFEFCEFIGDYIDCNGQLIGINARDWILDLNNDEWLLDEENVIKAVKFLEACEKEFGEDFEVVMQW